MKKSIQQLVIGILISTAFFMCLWVLNFTEVINGNCYKDPESVNTRLFYITIFVFLSISSLAYKYYKADCRVTSLILLFSVSFLAFSSVKICSNYFTKSTYCIPFDEQTWLHGKEESKIKIARFFVKEGGLNGYKFDDLIEKIGGPTDLDSKFIFYYLGGVPRYHLCLELEDDTIVSSSIVFN